MKKGLLFTGVLSAGLLLAACGNVSESVESTATESAASSEDTVIKVASHTTPMTDIVELAAEVVEKPYTIELVEVSDNIQYNEAVLNDEADASFAQHEPFMEVFNEERNGDLVAIQPIYNAVVGFYAPEYESIEDIEDSAEVAIPSDMTNEARALHILDAQGLIDVPDETFVTVDDITENDKNLNFTHVDLLNLNASYQDGVDLVFNYPTYISEIGLTPEEALFLEEDDSNRFALQIVTREGNADSEKIQALKAAFTSQEVYDYLEELAASGHLEPAFENPSEQ
ncbi:MetQ/NlpA family ABC transporter substrate-binding protein [Aerococcus urinaeequi]|uniref:MetQ/NlpA family ABC transporter substrate-binding protein n=1 Tax=Aerococcus urinaeequi TaxID=51665 RepID=A0AA47J3P8_9LACT|nr:MetQ/NlpA family ABC transporter substrate-binding protein [Aerococcus urinaeequi]WAT24987.1 MetQ/NlpA family ABC transporter substrate-binding protein [Aerococcus urinaeequi]